MVTRIKFRYDDGSKDRNRHNADIAVSKKTFKVDGKDVYLYLNFKDFTFEFLDLDGNIIHKGGNTKNRAVLLRQAKAELRKRGCRFGKEKRTKKESITTSNE
jgi:hypothetical protein